ncbi:unnamed protein product [Microthlaspi erraticum]|uniref:Uncharacterized protein n=1 Tax=Microthlaspi erraticum TaxID=1685480 RepID=A0A6D2KCX1_9BRAS|nr:unnamed protein product [Microthlaspi erraticum]
MAPTFPRSRSLLTTPRRLPAQEPHRASSFETKGRRRQHAEAEEEFQGHAPTRSVNSTELRVESACLRTLDSSTIQRPTRTSLRATGLPTTASSEHSSTKAKGATHTSTMKR